MFKITIGWLMQNRTKKGAWTKAQFDILDLKFPPTKGWMTMCVGGGIQDKTKLAFESAAHITCKSNDYTRLDQSIGHIISNKDKLTTGQAMGLLRAIKGILDI